MTVRSLAVNGLKDRLRLNSKGLSLCFFELNSPGCETSFIVTFVMVSRDGRAY